MEASPALLRPVLWDRVIEFLFHCLFLLKLNANIVSFSRTFVKVFQINILLQICVFGIKYKFIYFLFLARRGISGRGHRRGHDP